MEACVYQDIVILAVLVYAVRESIEASQAQG
jgi:hypothetical protein